MASIDGRRRVRSTRTMDTVSLASSGSRADSVSTWNSNPPLLTEKKTCTFLGKDLQEWLRILAYHLIFLVLVAIFWIICWLTFIYTLDYVTPRYYGNITGHLDQPGMGYRPKLDPKRNLIWFAPGENYTWDAMAEQMNQFFNQYEKTRQRNLVSCANQAGPPKDQACAFDVDTFGIRQSPCLRQSEYRWGFLDNKPCVVLKLNKMVGWKPEQFIKYVDYDDDRKEDEECKLPGYKRGDKTCDKIPDELMASYKMKKDVNNVAGAGIDYFDPDLHIGVTCNGRNDADIDLVKNVEYWPKFQGFPRNFYPFLNQEGFISPIVLVQFTVELQKLVMIECKAWARNLRHDRYAQIGQVNFEILIDGSMPKGWKPSRTYLGPYLNAGLELGNARIIEDVRRNDYLNQKK